MATDEMAGENSTDKDEKRPSIRAPLNVTVKSNTMVLRIDEETTLGMPEIGYELWDFERQGEPTFYIHADGEVADGEFGVGIRLSPFKAKQLAAWIEDTLEALEPE